MRTTSGIVVGQIVRVLDPCKECPHECADPASDYYGEPCGQGKLKGKLLRVIDLEAPEDDELNTWHLTVETLDGEFCTDYVEEWVCEIEPHPLQQLAECGK